MLIATNLLLLATILAAVLVGGPFILAKNDICFTFGIEGAAKMVVKGGMVHVRTLMWYKGHYLNDPRLRGYQPDVPVGEVLPSDRPDKHASLYAWWELHWKLYELFGIYWYGLYPFKKIYVHEFEWVEQKTGEDGNPAPRHRKELTDHIFVKDFPYWIRLSAAEDKDNFELDLDYLLTLRINNPQSALFRTDDWLKRTTADANNNGKTYVGSRAFDGIKRETEAETAGTSDFAASMFRLNENLVTEPDAHGTRVSYGVTISGAAMVGVTPAGSEAPIITEALAARRAAELHAEAEVATAKGKASAKRELANGDADAIKAVYDKVQGYGDFGIAMRQMDTLAQAAASPNTTFVWANNPLTGITDWFSGLKPIPPGTVPKPANDTGGA